MKLNAYQQATATTAVYPRAKMIGDGYLIDLALLYLTLGVAGEAGEIAQHISILFRGGNVKAVKESLQYELGDLFWYVSEITTHMGWLFGNIWPSDIMESSPGNIKPGEFAVTGMQLIEAATGLAEQVKKSLRDDKGALSAERRTAIEDHLVGVTAKAIQLCLDIGLKPEDVLQANIDKLAKRKAEGKIHGSGSKR